MKKAVLGMLACVLCICMMMAFSANFSVAERKEEGSGIQAHGALRVEGTQLVGREGEKVALRGVSSHGIAWYPRYLNSGAMATLKEYGANLFRIAMYTKSEGAYIENPQRSLDYLYMGIESALQQDMYVIVDWHILEDSNPLEYAAQAEAFFQEISSRYGDNAGIIYEICNEPNGDTEWSDVKTYAERVIPVIRGNAPGAVILVGTPSFCTDFTGPLREPLGFDNIMYSLHRYVDVSTSEPCAPGQLAKLIDRGLPVFVSEWGVSLKEQAYLAENGGGGASTEGAGTGGAAAAMYPEAARPFLEVMDQYHVSWAAWDLSNKEEQHSIIKADCNKLSGWTEEDLTDFGKMVFEHFQ